MLSLGKQMTGNAIAVQIQEKCQKSLCTQERDHILSITQVQSAGEMSVPVNKNHPLWN